MANAKNDKRHSTCSVCGKRLSIKTLTKNIEWLPSKIVDEGLYCVECYKGKDGTKPSKKL
jgi:hypothetical protein